MQFFNSVTRSSLHALANENVQGIAVNGMISFEVGVLVRYCLTGLCPISFASPLDSVCHLQIVFGLVLRCVPAQREMKKSLLGVGLMTL